jgi:hypothetical protein
MFTNNVIISTKLMITSELSALLQFYFSYLLSSSIFYDNIEVRYHLLCKWKGDYYAKKRTPPVDS